MRWRHHESIHAGRRIWEIWTPELLWPAHVEAARNRRSRVSDRAPNAAPERRRSPPWPQRRTAHPVRSRTASTPAVERLGPRREPVFWGTPSCGPKPTIGGAQLRVSSIVQSDRPAGFHRQSPSTRTRRPMSSVSLGKSRRPDDPTETRLHGRRPRVGTSRDRRKDGNLQLPWARHHPVAPCRWLHSRVGMVLPTIWLEEGIAGIRDRKWRSPRGQTNGVGAQGEGEG